MSDAGDKDVQVREYRVLVLPGGTEIGLEIGKSLGCCKDVRLFSAGQDVSNHAPYVFTDHFIVPDVHAADCIERLNEVIVGNSIDYVFPAHDDVIVALAQNTERLKSRVLCSPLETCMITRSKSATYRFLDGVVPVPKLYRCAEDVVRYPVFVKPDRGEGSRGIQLVEDARRLRQLVQEGDGRIILEYLPGEEYTVDCFCDRERGLLFCSGRERVRTRSGISMCSRVSPRQDVFVEYARAIANRLSFHGAWFFQVKRSCDGVLTLLEVAPRIAGTMALHRVQGVNLPLLSIYEQERVPIATLVNRTEVEIDRALVNRYRHGICFSTVYVDLDDTLILHGKVNVQVVCFIYQCHNDGRKVILLTKHDGDLASTLAEFRLSGLFNEVIHLKSGDAKSDFITEPDAILLDDSFSERKAASDRLGISTFDCSMLELLLDERK